MADVVRTATAYAGGEAMRLCKSKVISIVDDTANRILAVQVPRKAFIQSITVDCIEAINGITAEVDIGFIGNGEADDTVFFQNSGAYGSGVALGEAAAADKTKKYFENGTGCITVSPVKGTATTGKIRLFVEYTVIH